MTQPPDRGTDVRGTGFVASLHPTEEAALLKLGRTVRFHRDATIFSEGDVSGRVVVLVKGRVKVSSNRSEGHEVVSRSADPAT